jgi:hypothetical protein
MFKKFFIALGSIFVMSSAVLSGAQAADSNTLNVEVSTGGNCRD